MNHLFTPQELWRFSYLSWPALSGDGRLTAVTVMKPDPDGVCRSTVRVYDSDTGKIIYETPEGVHEMQPRFGNGGVMHVLCDASGSFQVWELVLDRRYRRQLTTLRHGVQHYDVCGDRIAFEAMVYPVDEEKGLVFTEMQGDEPEAFASWLDQQPYVAEDLTYKMDEWFGMRKGNMPRIGLCGGGKAPELLPGAPMEGVYPALSPDGENVAFFGYPHDGTDGRKAELMYWVTGDSTVRILSGELGVSPEEAPVFSENGRTVFVLAYKTYEDGSSQVAAGFPISGSEPVLVPDMQTEDVCEGVGGMTISRTVMGENRATFALNGDKVIFMGSFHGETALYQVSYANPSRVERLDLPYEDLYGFAMNGNGDLALLAGSREVPPDLYAGTRRLTDEHAWLKDYPQGRTEEVHIRSRDGKSELTYFYTHPLKEDGPAPVVLDIKGGPTTMYARAYWHEFHALSAAGFGVIHGNPRGSSGYGRAFRGGGVCWKDESMHDLLDMCHDAVSRGWADPARLGVTGGSYGGYMTLKLIGKTQEFAAAAGQRVFANPGTSYGTGDVGWVRAGGEVPPHFSMLRYLEDRARGSNVSRIDSFSTPLLLLHGYRDFRCTFEQSEQVFVAMKERRPEVPVRLVMFPKENHALTRTGNMKSQVRHLQEIVEWMQSYLEKKEEADHE